jgi:hypothetical protein
LTIELTLAQELIPPPNLDKGARRGSCRRASKPFNRRHVQTPLDPQDCSRKARVSHIS